MKSALSLLLSPLYTYAAADHLAAVSHGTSRRWLSGYRYMSIDGEMVERPPVTLKSDDIVSDGVSFIDLIEVVVIGRLKAQGFSLRAIREIVRNCQEIMDSDRPLVSLDFRVGGREVFVEQGGRLVQVHQRKRMQAWTEVLAPFIETLDYGEQFARRWFPLGRNEPIVVDPEYGFGFPVIEGSGVRTEIIRERFEVGDSQLIIASDFNIAPIDVERALRFEMTRLAA